MRSALAGKRLASYFAHKRHTEMPSFSTPEQNTVAITDMGVPSPQCRLDTYFAAALCNPENREVNSQDDLNQPWLCLESSELSVTLRPKCWFNAKNTVDKEHSVSDLLLLPRQGY